jgi:hypothetical protein
MKPQQKVVSPKHQWTSTELHSVTSRKTVTDLKLSQWLVTDISVLWLLHSVVVGDAAPTLTVKSVKDRRSTYL